MDVALVPAFASVMDVAVISASGYQWSTLARLVSGASLLDAELMSTAVSVVDTVPVVSHGVLEVDAVMNSAGNSALVWVADVSLVSTGTSTVKAAGVCNGACVAYASVVSACLCGGHCSSF